MVKTVASLWIHTHLFFRFMDYILHYETLRVFVCHDLVQKIESTLFPTERDLMRKIHFLRINGRPAGKEVMRGDFPWIIGSQVTLPHEIQRAESYCCFWHFHKSLRTTKLVTGHTKMTIFDISCQLPIRSLPRWILPHFCFLNLGEMHLTGWS